MKKIIIIIIIIVIVLLVGLIFFLEKTDIDTGIKDISLGNFLYQKIVQENKSFKMPETNPFKVETNPIKKVKTNPFE